MVPRGTLEWMLTDRCGLIHTGSKASVPAIEIMGAVRLMHEDMAWGDRGDSWNLKSHLYGQALSIYNGWARAYSTGGEVNILGTSENLPSFSISFFAYLKAKYVAGTNCGCNWGPYFTANSGTSSSDTRSTALLVHPYQGGYQLYTSNVACSGWSGLVTHSFPHYQNWAHITTVYDSNSFTITNYLNGEYQSTNVNSQLKRCQQATPYSLI